MIELNNLPSVWILFDVLVPPVGGDAVGQVSCNDGGLAEVGPRGRAFKTLCLAGSRSQLRIVKMLLSFSCSEIFLKHSFFNILDTANWKRLWSTWSSRRTGTRPSRRCQRRRRPIVLSRRTWRRTPFTIRRKTPILRSTTSKTSFSF